MPSIRISLSIAQTNVLLECVSSAMEWTEGQIKNPDLDDETKRNIVEKATLIGEIGLKLVKQAGPYLKSEPLAATDAGGVGRDG